MFFVQDLQLWKVFLLSYQIERFLESCKVQIYEIQLVHNPELREVLLMLDQMGRFLENLRYIHWQILLVQDMELLEVSLMGAHIDMASLRDLQRKMILV